LSRRATLITAAVFVGFVFLGISLLLARALTGEGAERAKVLDTLRAQARGDTADVLRELPACARDELCVRLTRERVARLQRPGAVEILSYSPSARVTMTRRAGVGRVAWRAGRSLPVVQCVRVLRDGPLTGGEVELLSMSNPIATSGSCR
jgi:hypothetical protein